MGDLPDVKKVIVAGSVRRRKETIGDADVLAVSKNPKPVDGFFYHHAGGEVNVIAHKAEQNHP